MRKFDIFVLKGKTLHYRGTHSDFGHTMKVAIEYSSEHDNYDNLVGIVDSWSDEFVFFARRGKGFVGVEFWDNATANTE